jgi:hypothetical protein
MATWYFRPSLLRVWGGSMPRAHPILLYCICGLPNPNEFGRPFHPLFPAKLARYIYLYSEQSPLPPFLSICIILFLLFYFYLCVCRLLSAVSAPCSTSTETFPTNTSCEAVPLSVFCMEKVRYRTS